MAVSHMGHDVAWRMYWPMATAHKAINVGAEAQTLTAD
jgi:hypothetical protein